MSLGSCGIWSVVGVPRSNSTSSWLCASATVRRLLACSTRPRISVRIDDWTNAAFYWANRRHIHLIHLNRFIFICLGVSLPYPFRCICVYIYPIWVCSILSLTFVASELQHIFLLKSVSFLPFVHKAHKYRDNAHEMKSKSFFFCHEFDLPSAVRT